MPRIVLLNMPSILHIELFGEEPSEGNVYYYYLDSLRPCRLQCIYGAIMWIWRLEIWEDSWWRVCHLTADVICAECSGYVWKRTL